MSISQFLRILKGRYRLALSVFLATLAMSIVVSLLLPKVYTATSSILVDIKAADPIAGTVPQVQMLPAFMSTHIDILTSDRVAERVVRDLKLDQEPSAREQWQKATGGKGTLQGWLAEALQRKLDAKISRDSNVISVSYSAVDPKFAALISNAFAQAFVSTTLELRVEPARLTAAWFDEHTKALRQNLEEAQAKLTEYQREHAIPLTDERLDLESARLGELGRQLALTQTQTAEARSRQQARGEGTVLPEVLQSPLVQNLKSEVARTEARLRELAGRLGANHPQLQRAEAELTALRQRLNVEMNQVAGGVGTTNFVSERREAEVRAAVERQKRRVLALKSQRDELAVLAREVDSAQRAHDAANQRRLQASLESQLNLTNVAVLSKAIEPHQPTRPKLLLNALFGIFLGVAFCVCAALLMELRDPRIRATSDLEKTLQVAVLGVIENFSLPERRRRLLGLNTIVGT